jgi:HSP20 family protein
MDRFQRELNRVMDRVSSGNGTNFPALNVWANEEHALVTAELPGVDLEKLDVSVVGDTVTISGERTLPEMGQDVRFHRRERWSGSYSRTMQMPFQIDANKVEANFRNGVLLIELPRAEEDRPRRISVGGSE